MDVAAGIIQGDGAAEQSSMYGHAVLLIGLADIHTGGEDPCGRYAAASLVVDESAIDNANIVG